MLDTQYPGSRFVLTVRPVEQWIDSRRRHVENNIRRKAAGEYDGRFIVVEEEKWRREWSDHLDKVRAFFADARRPPRDRFHLRSRVGSAVYVLAAPATGRAVPVGESRQARRASSGGFVSAAAPRSRRPRVFGLGLNKTGTSSLHEALTILGYESLHWGGPEIRRKVEAALEAGVPLLSNLDPRYDAFSDILALSTNYAGPRRAVPGQWIRPDRAAGRRLDRQSEAARRAEHPFARARGVHGTFLVVDEPAWRREWAEHLAAVREYFAGRDDLLELDVTADPGWESLSSLLRVDVPDVPFPWENRDHAPVPDRC